MDRQGEPPDAHKGKRSACLQPEVTMTLQVALCYRTGCLPRKNCFFPFLASTQCAAPGHEFSLKGCQELCRLFSLLFAVLLVICIHQ